MDLWERLQTLRQTEDYEELQEWSDLCWRRNEERAAELPVPYCCPTIAGMRVVRAVLHDSAPIWISSHPTELRSRSSYLSAIVQHCPFCGTSLPGFRKKACSPLHLADDTDDYYCGHCQERHDSCYCSLPVSAWEVDNAPPVIAVVGHIVDSGNILTVSRKNNPQDKGHPGGKVDPGETFEQALCRELLEETGLVAKDYHLIFDAVDNLNIRCLAFRVTGYEGEIHTTEKGLVEWVPMERLLEDSCFKVYNRSLYRLVYPYELT